MAETERLPGLDVLRAVALLGIFLINIEFMARPIEAVGYGIEPGLSGLDFGLAWLAYVFVHGKFWMLFALLFGAGFALAERRAERSGRAFARPYLRRIGVLFVLGIAHGTLLWAGDILHTYAIAAGVLMLILRGRAWWLLLPVPLFAAALALSGSKPMLGGVIGFLLFAASAAWIRRGGTGRLWKAGAGLYCLTATIMLAMSLPGALSVPDAAAQAEIAARVVEIERELQHARSVNADGGWSANLALRWDFMRAELPRETALLVFVVGMFLLGAWTVRAGVFADPAAHRALLRRAVCVALPLGAALALAGVWLGTRFDPLQQPLFRIGTQLMMLAALPLALGYAATVLLCLQRWPRLAAIAPAGRMALTNYLLQSLIGTWLFFGYGAGLAGSVGRAGQYALVLAIFAMQLVASRWWLQRHAFGPAEWAWRALTYGTWPRWRRAPAPPAMEAAAAVP